MTMTITTVFLLLAATSAVGALPLADVHVKFVSPPNVYEHSITTDGDRTFAQKSFISIGRRSTAKLPKNLDYNYRPSLQRSYSRQAIPVTNPGNVESLWPVGVFLPPIDVNDLGYSWYETRRAQPDVYKLRARDPYLLTGREAMMAVKYLYGLGELFFDDYPHAVALLRHQEERMLNGLHGHVLSSLNPRFPFQRKGVRGN
ncbi:hypothetical protein DMN91_003647 [Ooceraea biroi]|uniref:Uncharacterized protein n=1 Tax=Ooceraea biroi TaxID=2015173 RepID=A0A3L8DTF3_OOCBI|nr:uncharacterized protein LOC105280863 isoform X1 [Ooceraea biroi]RLU23443.1 hypothetical protein DMN91_003647 [Ooceraea biroi]